MKLVELKINNMAVSVPEGTTILEAARQIGIHIPTLCYLKGINEIGACRICLVEVKGMRTLVASCVYPVAAGMEVFTNTEKVIQSRKTTLELLLSDHEKKCLSCVRSGSCELQTLCNEYGVDEDKYKGEKIKHEVDASTPHLIRDNNKCILCKRCVAACREQHVSVIGENNRGFDSYIGCAFEQGLGEVACVSCGQCIVACPTGALRERDSCDDVFDALNDPTKHVVVHTAPSIRVTLGECFDMKIGSNVKGKMVAALRRLGFDKVFDTDFAADLTIVEEATEFINRIKNSEKLPLITSCSPGWVKFCEHYYPELIDNLSTCKSPQQMMGAVIKTWYAQMNNIKPENIVTVSVMPCTAKKFEITRQGQSAAGFADNDFVLTTRELGRMIKRAHIDFVGLPDEKFDSALGESTGAAAIFGATGGVMEAALRTASEMLSKGASNEVEFKQVRGTEDIKEALYNIAGIDVRVAVVSGLKNAAVLLDQVKNKEKDYHFIEVMCCPGGCVNGGGQPIHAADVRNFNDLKAMRARALYDEDEGLPIRKSHDNPLIKEIYSKFLGEPGSDKAHHILHTSYERRSKY